ncbi:MAG: tetratricopeptide repeat protein [Terriglobales bacterium]
MLRTRPIRCLHLAAALLFAMLPPSSSARDSEPHWLRIDSDHFSVLTDADERKGRDIVVRFEQMRAAFSQLLMKTRVNIPEPFSIIALRNNEEFSKVAPTRQDEAIARGGFFIAGTDRDYFVLDASQDESWRAISGDFGRVLLNYNYPPAQDWFDEGFVAYFSSIKLDNTQMQIVADPEFVAPGGQTSGSPRTSFVDILNNATWLSIPELFATRRQTPSPPKNHLLFEAQSWMVMHYLVNQDKLSSTGTYLGLVESQKLPVEEAIQKAYGMTSAQLGQAAKDYFHALAPALQGRASGGPVPPPLKPAAAPLAADVVGSSTHEIPELEAQSLVAEMSLRLPEHRDQALKELDSIVSRPKGDNAVAHRAFGWDHMEQKEFDEAVEEYTKAVALDGRDPLTHFYLALWKFREAKLTGGETKGLANMMLDLHVVLDWDPEFAEAYNMLAMAQLEGGGVRAATDSLRAALQLSPRNQGYLLNMAKIYLAGKNWDAASAWLERLAASPDPTIASAARQDLQDIPFLKKYGVAPVHDAGSSATTPSTLSPEASAKPGPPPSVASHAIGQPKAAPSQAAQSSDDANDENPDQPPPQPQIDRRPILYAKGKLVAVDCSQAPVAILTVAAGAKSLKLRTPDYKSLTLVGADQFSCAWTNQSVSVNYKARDGANGDLVSVELH